MENNFGQEFSTQATCYSRMKTVSQDGRLGKLCAHLRLQPHQNYN